MSKSISTERVFSLSTFEGMRLFRKYQRTQPSLDVSTLIDLIEKVEADGPSLDLEAGAYLSTLVDADCPMDGIHYYQECIKAVLIKHQPLWSQAMRTGRKRFVGTLDPDDRDIFRAAGLMLDPPSEEVVLWWDNVVGHSRLQTDIEKMAQAREAERLTIESERAELQNLGIDKEPEWKGLDDNFAGYDVLSYRPGKHGLINLLIEVKSTMASPLRFFVTENEWKRAEQSPNAYIFHVWDMNQSPPILYLRTAQQIAPHIPSNNKKGQWKSALIPLGTR